MPYTNVAKPTGSSYTKLSPQGSTFFDDGGVTFDDPNTFFDGTNINAWTKVARPSQPFGLQAGMTMGLLIPLTTPKGIRTGDPWTRITKPT